MIFGSLGSDLAVLAVIWQFWQIKEEQKSAPCD